VTRSNLDCATVCAFKMLSSVILYGFIHLFCISIPPDKLLALVKIDITTNGCFVVWGCLYHLNFLTFCIACMIQHCHLVCFKADLAVKTVHLHKHYLLSLRQMDISWAQHGISIGGKKDCYRFLLFSFVLSF